MLRAEVCRLLDQALSQMGVEDMGVNTLLETPPAANLGDYAFPCFQLARILRKPPAVIARDTAGHLPRSPLLSRVEAVQAYVNLYFDPGEAARVVVAKVLEEADAFGHGDDGRGELVAFDFSSPNIARPFHVGHLRSTIIGHSLARIFESLGYRTVRINHLGDWGTQFGNLIAAYRRWGDPRVVESDPIRELYKLYVRFHRELGDAASLADEGRAAFRALEAGGAEEVDLWRTFRRLSLREFDRLYRRLGVTFDSHRGESAYNQKMDEVVARLEAEGLVTASEGALVVQLDGLPPCLIKKKDGATLYATRDVAAALHRYESHGFRHLFYVVGAPQSLHFRQVFGVLEKMGCTWVDRLEHIAFGHIHFGEGQFSTRKGHVIFLEDLLDEAKRRVLAIIERANAGLKEKDKVAEAVGIGAVIFNDLSHNRIKDIAFDWENVLNFDGDTGPYVQYTHARAASLLRRAEAEGLGPAKTIGGAELAEAGVLRLAKRLAEYPEIVRRAAEEREPSGIARHLILVCHEFNSFYHVHRVLESGAAPARLALTKAVKQVVKNGLWLLGIEAPAEM